MSDIKLAAMSLMWGGPVDDRFVPWLEQVKQIGYDGIAGFSDAKWNEAYVEKPKFFKGLIDDHGLELGSLNSGVVVDFDWYRKVCSFMQQVGCKHLVLMRGMGHQDGDLKALGALLDRIGEIALDYGVRAAYHNHSGYCGETFEHMDKLISYTDPQKFFVMCDCGHATKDFVHQPVARRAVMFLEKYWDKIDFIEFKDWNEETDLMTPVGEGLCDYDSVFSLIKEKNYTGWITVEQNGTSKDRTREECARISLDFIRKGLGL